ncbi:hypothetical protein ACFIJ5_04725 [Haloimpatiens sp. FM7330]|uniref:hypothetical protein n=1 Tax=Haloimpatiens sp. FM7330 TaxID=3298610 RepID=UPI00363F86D4
MAINPKDFIPRPGFVNRQGCLPDPCELCCIQVPKIFDQCLIKKCLKPTDDCEQLCVLIPGATDPSDVKKVGCCKNFDVKINSVSKCPVQGEPGYKRVNVNFTVTFEVDVEVNSTVETLTYTVTKSITIPKFYCPDPIAQISISKDCECANDLEEELIKLEVIADCLDSVICTVPNGDCCSECPDGVYLCITLGLFIIVKCELIVQLLIPCYGYCPAPPECPCTEDPCKEFMEREIPEFYPPQKMDDLFCDKAILTEEEE